jgi:hypothetical protein
VRRAWIGICAAVAALALVAGPGTASASQRVLRTAFVKLQATNGYEAYLNAFHQLHPRRHAHASVTVYNEDGGYAEYGVRALFTKRHLKASLGGFGRINLHIKNAARRSRPSDSAVRRLSSDAPPALSAKRRDAKADERVVLCFTSAPFQRRTFRGRIRFDGENGYTGVHANRVDGRYFSGNARCPRGRRSRGIFLTAKSGSVEFHASEYRNFPKEKFLYASQDEKVRRVSVRRAAVNYRGVFDFASDLSTAHVASEGALAGSADFTAPDQWTGDLTASFPGEAPVALTGPDFTARLKHR